MNSRPHTPQMWSVHLTYKVSEELQCGYPRSLLKIRMIDDIGEDMFKFFFNFKGSANPAFLNECPDQKEFWCGLFLKTNYYYPIISYYIEQHKFYELLVAVSVPALCGAPIDAKGILYKILQCHPNDERMIALGYYICFFYQNINERSRQLDFGDGKMLPQSIKDALRYGVKYIDDSFVIDSDKLGSALKSVIFNAVVVIE